MQISMGQEIVQFLHEAFRRKPRSELTPQQRFQRRGTWYFILGVVIMLLGVVLPLILAVVDQIPWAMLIWILGVPLSIVWIKFMVWYDKKGWEYA